MQLIEMAPASWGGSHWVMTTVLEVGYCHSPYFTQRGREGQSQSFDALLSRSFIALSDGLLTLLSTVPLAYVLIRCGYFLTLR